MNKPVMWTSKECADFMGISEKALRSRRQRGSSPPYVKAGRTVRYVPRDVARWIDENTHTMTRQVTA